MTRRFLVILLLVGSLLLTASAPASAEVWIEGSRDRYTLSGDFTNPCSGEEMQIEASVFSPYHSMSNVNYDDNWVYGSHQSIRGTVTSDTTVYRIIGDSNYIGSGRGSDGAWEIIELFRLISPGTGEAMALKYIVHTTEVDGQQKAFVYRWECR